MNLENLLAADEVRIRHLDLPVEAARTHQRRVEHVGTVGRGDQDDALIRLEAVHLDEQLVQGLLALVIAAAKSGAAMAADRVDLVDEDDAGGVLLRLFEHVAHARRADADEHFDEVGARDREERHARFAGDGARQQRLAGAGRPDKQHAARNAAAETLELLRIAQEFDDLLQILLGFVDAGDVFKRDAALRLGQKLRFRLAKAHRAAGAALHLAGEENPHREKRDKRQRVEQQRHHEAAAFIVRLGADRDVLRLQAGHEIGVVRRIGGERPVVVEVTDDLIAGDGHVMDTTLVYLGEQLAIRNVAYRRALAGLLKQHDKRDHEQSDDCPKREVPEVWVHLGSLSGAARSGLSPEAFRSSV